MLETERRTIVEFLRSSDPDLIFDHATMTNSELIELLMERINELELDYSIMSTAFVNGVNPARFDQFHDAIMQQYDMIPDGQEIPEHILDRIASQYR